MAHREFVDSAGLAWQVWDVRPHPVRSADDRRQHPRRDDPPEPHDPERRSGDERRLRPERRNHDRLPVTPGLEAGWLCFESTAEKRRLAPVPIGWDELADHDLERLCQEEARPTARREL